MISNSSPILVTKSFLPPREEFDALVDEIWRSGQLTNNGQLSKRFCREISEDLSIDKDRFVYVTNGTLALQLALHAALPDVHEGEIITTPFSYVATSSSILWEGFTPVYVDIDPQTLNIDPAKIEQAITKDTKAILAVHVFGNPCDVETIQAIADEHDLRVIYDAAHAFHVDYKEKSILEYGDVSVLSFHATKLFHTIEGGAVYSKTIDMAQDVELMKRFGHNGDEHLQLGINAKASEFQAAMGLANIKYIDSVIKSRKQATNLYDKLLSDVDIFRPAIHSNVVYNYAYYPILFKNSETTKTIIIQLKERNIFPRRYFYPSLNMLPYVKDDQRCPVSEDMAERILCLPLYNDIESEIIEDICEIVREYA